jgi:hypothetical protein
MKAKWGINRIDLQGKGMTFIEFRMQNFHGKVSYGYSNASTP